ncbi:histidine phosphatase family protein [Sphingomonas sp. IC-11]|uniref:histidine phosphatase family protein n=1 Tax=Sphingomonas sp. IC-11 TaxID=2898528 RepID=UPI001E610D73|nr:histidine phosphatase family protein [Sphingomonas sp. IC-11]MCD2316591.1 histidine phosphatase family protein [Sphingomonas sp. IC-11]
MTTIIHLVRHGAHADAGRVLTGRGGDDGLASIGRAQAAWAAERLGSQKVVHVESSPQRRTRETAGVIAAVCGAEPEIVEALDELDFGEWTGRVIADLDGDPDWTRWNSARSQARVPGGERMTDAVSRAVAHLNALGRQSWSGSVVCVSHADIIRGVVAHYLGLSLDRMLLFDVDPGSITSLVVGEWGGRLLSLNVQAA